MSGERVQKPFDQNSIFNRPEPSYDKIGLPRKIHQVTFPVNQLEEQSVTGWFHALQNGNETAAEQLWDRYFERIIKLAEGRFAADASYDEEDLAISVFNSLVRLAGEKKYREIANRDELWALLLIIAQRKMRLRERYHSRLKRGSDQHVRVPVDLNGLVDPKSNPQFAVEVAEECQRLLELLKGDELRQVALMKLDGFTNAHIAKQLDLTERTIKRKTAMIRKVWQQQLETAE